MEVLLLSIVASAIIFGAGPMKSLLALSLLAVSALCFVGLAIMLGVWFSSIGKGYLDMYLLTLIMAVFGYDLMVVRRKPEQGKI
jgi:hypothetical protein